MATLQFTEGAEVPAAIDQKKQLLPNIVDGMARTRPEAIYAETPTSPTNYGKGYLRITYSSLANAVNGVAWLLHNQLGKGINLDTIAYMGANDIAYVIMILGAAKAGYKILSVSPRNTIADHVSLFRTTDCNILLTPANPRSPVVTSILEVYPLELIDSPSLYDLLSGVYPPYPYRKKFAEAKLEPLVVLHTSGTTGAPKPIIYSHDYAASYVSWTRLIPPPGFRNQMLLPQSVRLFNTLPFFHAGSLFTSMFDALANQTTIITSLGGVAPSAENVVEGLKHVQVDSLLLAPPFMEKIASNPEMLGYVTKKVGLVIYSGGGVAQSAGDAFSSKTRTFNVHGSTEFGPFPTVFPFDRWPSEDWNYIHPNPHAGIEFRAVEAEPEVFEAVIVRKAELVEEQPIFKLFPHLTEYSTKDLFAPHPSEPDLWTHKGRIDDRIVFKPGYMCNPIAMEQQVSYHPEVRAALMAGTGRFQPALIVEPASGQTLSTEAKRGLVEQIWPIVQKANQAYNLGARISKSHILVLDREQPLSYSGKGTVRRLPTLRMYENILDDFYDREGDNSLDNTGM